MPGGFNTAMGEILKKYASVLDSDGDELNHHNAKVRETAPSQNRGFVPYADSGGGKKKSGGFYSDKPGEELRGYSSSGNHGRKEMEGEVYRQTKAADVDAEKAFDKMAYHGAGDEPKTRKKSPYAQP